MKVTIPATITYSNYVKDRKRYWKTRNGIKSGVYKTKLKRIVLRIGSSSFATKLIRLDKSKRQIKLIFHKEKEWIATLNKVNQKNLTLQCYPYYKTIHPYVQIVANKSVPDKLMRYLECKIENKKCVSLPILVKIDLDEWKDTNLKPWDFLYHTEMHAKKLMEFALKNDFTIDFITKGREYDLQLIGPKGTKFIIAISSHDAKYETRSKQHRIQKTLTDIAKMIPSIYNATLLIPIIVTQPYEFDGSWSFTTDNYLKFYKNKYNFNFIETNFKNNWTSKICKKLLELDLVATKNF